MMVEVVLVKMVEDCQSAGTTAWMECSQKDLIIQRCCTDFLHLGWMRPMAG